MIRRMITKAMTSNAFRLLKDHGFSHKSMFFFLLWFNKVLPFKNVANLFAGEIDNSFLVFDWRQEIATNER